MSDRHYDDMSKFADNALAELATVTTVKDLRLVVSKYGSAMGARNADVAPQLLFHAFHSAFDKLFERLMEIGWSPVVADVNKGLSLVDCAVLADLLHVIHLPLCNNNLPMDPVDREIAYNAMKRLESALSSLNSSKLAALSAEWQKRKTEQENDEAAFMRQRFIIVWTGVDRTAITLRREYKHAYDLHPRASRECFDHEESAASYASALAARHAIAYIAPSSPQFLD